MKCRTAVSLLLLTAQSACSSAWGPRSPDGPAPPRGAHVIGPDEAARCTRLPTGADNPYRVPLPGPETRPELSQWLEGVPLSVRRTLVAAGLEPAVARLLRDRSARMDVEWMVRRHAVSTHLQSLQVQLDAATFEADCSGDLLESVSGAIEQEESSRELRWSILSIVAGALGAVGAGTWELVEPDAHGAVVVGLAGGAVAGALGIVAFVPQSRSIVMHHRRNLLRPIYVGEDPAHVYPTFVFRSLTLPVAHGPTPRDDLLGRFRTILQDAVPPEQRDRAIALLYGDGGVYDVRLLRVREQMLDELESVLAGGTRELEVVQRYLGRTLDANELTDAD